MPLLETKGAASAQGFGEFLQQGSVNYIEDVFSTFLYTGNASTQTITNGIDLSTKGGMVWIKNRSLGGTNNALQDTVRGRNNILFSNDAVENQAYSTSINSFNTTGFTLGSENLTNQTSQNFVSWTFREQPKFFDVVTYTGTGSATTIAHNLESVPGCIIVKRTNSARDWAVYHRSLGATQGIYLNSSGAAFSSLTALWNGTTPTSTVFSVGANADVNGSGSTYVAYLFAHNAGGFGLSGTDNVISCGSYTGAAGPLSVNLGYEPQWVLIKCTSTAGTDWVLQDTMRGMSLISDQYLQINTAGAENSISIGLIYPNANGFTISDTGYGSWNVSGRTYIYIAIRRGPMKVPTSGTSVFNPAYGTNVSGSFDTSFPVDMGVYSGASISNGAYWSSRLTASRYLASFNTNAEGTFGTTQPWDRMEDWYATADNRFIGWGFRRAPGFFDVVCYTGTGSATTQAHNLGVAPELMIVKRRNISDDWSCYSAGTGATNYLRLDTTQASLSGSTRWNNTAPTSSVFTIGTDSSVNANTSTYVAYLFASCPGVSKVGSYTGTGALQTVNCGFTGGARFVLIKRTDSTGDWYVYDSARGISSGNDPYLLLNSTAAEVTGTNYVDTDSTGFKVTAAAPAGLNANGGSFVFLAIA